MSVATKSKSCVKCGADVSHSRRMKDHNGLYWCVRCGKTDEHDKHPEKSACVDCRGHYTSDQVKLVGGEIVCVACVAARQRGLASMASPAETERSERKSQRVQKIRMAVGFALTLGVGAVWWWMRGS